MMKPLLAMKPKPIKYLVIELFYS